MTTYRKKLIEVALPLAAINAESAREKSIRHGHPSTLHLWWARRPLAACRAVLFSSLVDDPDSDQQYRNPDGTVDEEAAGIKRADLFNLIEELVAWENSNNTDVLRSARAEIARCVASRLIETEKLQKDSVVYEGTTVDDLVKRGHCRPIPMGLDKKAGRVRFSFDVSRLPDADAVHAFLAQHAPPVLDPFAGGGSIPLEAQRLGLRAYASDLNPVPVLINKALIEIPPTFAGRPPVNPESHGDAFKSIKKGRQSKVLIEKEWPGARGLAEDIRYYGQWMREEAKTRIGHLYPMVKVTDQMAKDRPDLKDFVGQEFTVIAWLWARTVECPNPGCRAQIPLVKSYWLSKKANKQVWMEPILEQDPNRVRFAIRLGSGQPEPGTVSRKGGRCACCGNPVPFDHIRTEGKSGRIGTQLLAIVANSPSGRIFLPPVAAHEEVSRNAKANWAPDAAMAHNPFALRPPLYGLDSYGEVFSQRQLLALDTFCSLIPKAREKIIVDAGESNGAYADAIVMYLSLAISRLSDICNALCVWENTKTQVRHLFTRQAIPMLWDFAEPNVFGDAAGDFGISLGSLCKVIDRLGGGIPGIARNADATDPFTEIASALISTDPPYYNNIDYADLSDFFYVWLRRCLNEVLPSLFATVLTPKMPELVATPYRFNGSKERAKEHFLTGTSKAFGQMHATQQADYPLTVYYAFKQVESNESEGEIFSGEESTASTGWEIMLAALIKSGFSITGTWPMRTEASNKPMAFGMNALASSIVIVCRSRSTNAAIATRKQFMATLRTELPDALRNLQHGNIAPVDLAQSAIGPGMAVFTRYAKVLESDGSSMSVRTALGIINQTLDEVLAEQEGEFDGDTRWALAWFDQFGVDEGPFGDAETLSKAKNTAINGLVEAGVIIAKGGKVRLIRRDELPSEWSPVTDKRLTVWEVTQHLIHRLDEKGEIGAAKLVSQLGGMGEIARDLAYRLYSTCERKKWAQEAMAYNSLVVAWPELSKLAQAQRQQQPRESQTEMF